VTAGSRRLLGIVVFGVTVGLAGIAVLIAATWPHNGLGVYLHERQNRAANIRALEGRIARETDALERAFYRAWLAEEKGDLEEAIRGFQSLRDDAGAGTALHLKSALRLGLAYGGNRQPDRELATYQALMDRYPGPSRLSQATYHLRRGERDQARRLLDDALARDEVDGSLGADRSLARHLRSGLGAQAGGVPGASP
jgi:hypothetical protein